MFYRPELTVYQCEQCDKQIIVGYGEQPPDKCPECGHDEGDHSILEDGLDHTPDGSGTRSV